MTRAAALRPLAGLPASFSLVVALLLALLAAPRVAAVGIPVTNCLPDRYHSSPTPLQWQPRLADAKFDTQSDRHNLQLVVWGNVTGALTLGALPPPGDAYWSDPKESNGKIIETPDPEADNKKATTLIRTVNVLTYEPWRDAANFCKDALVNGSCPLAPVFRFDNA